MRTVPLALLISTLVLLTGCANPINPSFDISSRDARKMLREMKQEPKTLERPVVVVAGLLDPGFNVTHIQGVLNGVTDQREMVEIVTFWSLETGTFNGCRDRLVKKIERKFGAGENGETVEVDIIAFSMGGLVARHAARPREDGPRLKVRRLFTISTPHRGANMASLLVLDARAHDMRQGSEFLQGLDELLPEADYELYSYVRLGDTIVGPENAAPPGHGAWWVPTPAFSFAHLNAASDPRILADIMLRLRGEAPIATTPPAPLEAALAPDKTEFSGSAADPGT